MINISIFRSILISVFLVLILVFIFAKTPIIEPFLSHEEETKGTIQSLSIALDILYTDAGFYPSTEQGLITLFESSEVNDWNPPYLTDKKSLLDDWGNPFVYLSPPGCKVDASAHYEIYSKGRNGIDDCGDEDDIYYSKLKK